MRLDERHGQLACYARTMPESFPTPGTGKFVEAALRSAARSLGPLERYCDP